MISKRFHTKLVLMCVVYHMLMLDGPEQAIQAVYSLVKELSLQGSGPRLLVMAFPGSHQYNDRLKCCLNIPQEEWHAYIGVPGSCLSRRVKTQSSSTTEANTAPTIAVATIARNLIAIILLNHGMRMTG